jgi:glycosyltransferase involved in cell wall biosynthesis
MRIVLIPDRPNWAWHYMAIGLTRYAPPQYECHIVWPGEHDGRTVDQWDAILQFSWAEANTRVDPRLVTLVASSGCEFTPWKTMLNKQKPAPNGEDWRASVSSRISNQWTAGTLLPRFDGIIAVNPHLQNIASRYNPHVRYMPSAVDTEFWERADHKPFGTKLRVGWVGQYDPAKPDPKGYEWILTPLMARCENFCDFCLVTNNADTAHTVYQMRMFYQEIDVLICTSISEGTPMPALEAMSCGRPVISTSVGDMPMSIVEGWNGGLIGEYSDAGSAAVVINNLESWLRCLEADRDYLAEIGHNAADRMRKTRCWSYWAKNWLQYVAGE